MRDGALTLDMLHILIEQGLVSDLAEWPYRLDNFVCKVVHGYMTLLLSDGAALHKFPNRLLTLFSFEVLFIEVGIDRVHVGILKVHLQELIVGQDVEL